MVLWSDEADEADGALFAYRGLAMGHATSGAWAKMDTFAREKYPSSQKANRGPSDHVTKAHGGKMDHLDNYWGTWAPSRRGMGHFLFFCCVFRFFLYFIEKDKKSYPNDPLCRCLHLPHAAGAPEVLFCDDGYFSRAKVSILSLITIEGETAH
jgi:hypothetical protein